jgi:hypothetical protein
LFIEFHFADTKIERCRRDWRAEMRENKKIKIGKGEIFISLEIRDF